MDWTHGKPTKQDLSPARQTLVTLCQRLNYGRLERLHIRDGEPTFDPLPTMIREIKFGGRNGPRPERRFDDFPLKDALLELFELLDRNRDCVIERLEIQAGLPYRMFVEERVG